MGEARPLDAVANDRPPRRPPANSGDDPGASATAPKRPRPAPAAPAQGALEPPKPSTPNLL